ncbi:hypothetical protein [Spirosoma sp.]|uniref:hypothetical protein n=1 Tax=Spirosoma sp. TaxID=1899569 RepID=UPI00262ED2E7|nr:hypothetical protein [Spirosoma sp.]MCX6217625.1 hypothetical protein [Spirosoma sp.]
MTQLKAIQGVTARYHLIPTDTMTGELTLALLDQYKRLVSTYTLENGGLSPTTGGILLTLQAEDTAKLDANTTAYLAAQLDYGNSKIQSLTAINVTPNLIPV